MSIVVIGAVFVDIKGYPTAVYNPTGRNVGRIEQVHGGVSRNVAEDIANINLKTKFVSLVDNSGSGSDVLNKLNSRGVDTTYVRKTDDGMGTWLAIFDNNGDLAASISKRPNLGPINDIIDEYGDEIFGDADSIIIQIDMTTETLDKVFYYADKYNIGVYALVSNMSIALERRSYLTKTACIVCNLQEAGLLFQADYSNLPIEEIEKITVENTVNSQFPKLVVTMGAQGAVYADNKGDHGWVSAINVDVIDTTGAGDSFLAGVAAGLTYGKSLKEACSIGTKMAASVITTTESVCPIFKKEEFNL